MSEKCDKQKTRTTIGFFISQPSNLDRRRKTRRPFLALEAAARGQRINRAA
jgi:hypothetical protein